MTYPGSSAPSGTCQAPNQVVLSNTKAETTSHEVRFNTPVSDNGVSATFGFFTSETEIAELNFFNYEGSQYNLNFSGVANAWAPN